MDLANTPETAFLATLIPYATVVFAVVVIAVFIWGFCTATSSGSSRSGFVLVAAFGLVFIAEPLTLVLVGV